MAKQVVLQRPVHERAKALAARESKFLNVIVNEAVDRYVTAAEKREARSNAKEKLR